MEQEINVTEIMCKHCGSTDIDLFAYGEETKYGSIKRGIEGQCKVCKEFSVFTEEDN